jgi:hypothetical protein
MTTPPAEAKVMQSDHERARQAVAEILANDPVCGGRVCSGTDQAIVEAVGRVLAPSATAGELDHIPDAGKLVEALEAVRDGDVPRPVGKRWRGDEAYSKNDQCIHNVWMYEDCGNCTAAFIDAALTEARAGEKG